MSASVKLSLKSARWLLDIGYAQSRASNNLVSQELRQAIARAERTSEVKARLRKPKAAKKRSKREETSALRAMALARASDRCEACGAEPLSAAALFRPLEMDHFFGRGHVAQELANVWILCARCHRAKTDYQPTRREWLEEFVRHTYRYGYEAARVRALGLLAISQARGGQ